MPQVALSKMLWVVSHYITVMTLFNIYGCRDGWSKWVAADDIYIYVNVCSRLQICVFLFRFSIPPSSNGFFRVNTCVSMEEKKSRWRLKLDFVAFEFAGDRKLFFIFIFPDIYFFLSLVSKMDESRSFFSWKRTINTNKQLKVAKNKLEVDQSISLVYM